MIGLLNNTMEIICALSNSDTGYLLKLNLKCKQVISLTGGSSASAEPFSDLIFNLFISDKLEEEISKEDSFLKKLRGSLGWNSFFLKEIFRNAEDSSVLFLILLSKKNNNYTQTKISSLNSITGILSEQVKKIETEIFFSSGNEDNAELLKYSRRLFEMMLEVSEDIIFMLDEEGRFLSINNFGAASIDYDVKEILGMHFLEFIAMKVKPSAAKAFAKMIESENTLTFETTLVGRYGNEIIFEISGSSLMKNGKVAGIIAIGRNITELRMYEERILELNTKLTEADRIISIEKLRSNRQKAILFELNKMKSEFVSNISHELRTPLASIIGFSETIASDPNMPADMKNEFNLIILNEGKRLAKLINDVLDVSRIESGELVLNKIEVDISKILNEALENNTKIINDKNIIVTTDMQDDNIILKADKERIFQVFNNLINNAAKFTGNGGRIHITLQTLYKEIEISISDTGIGIPEKDLPYIFQKFYRVSRPGTEIPGTGLGLVFVKQIVDLHKGFITIQSEINKGTTVILKLPRDARI